MHSVSTPAMLDVLLPISQPFTRHSHEYFLARIETNPTMTYIPPYMSVLTSSPHITANANMAIVSRFPPVDPATLDLPGLLDWQARNNPHLSWAVTPDAKSHTSATRSITFAELAGAAHRVAHCVRPNRRGEDGQVVALLINCDTVQYVAMILGVMRAGLVPMPVSPRNSLEAARSLLEKTSCRHVITQTPVLSVAKELHSADLQTQILIEELPSLYDIFPSLDPDRVAENLQTFEPYPSGATPQESDLVIYIHSSGSTGLPKPIPLTQKIARQWSQRPIVFDTGARGIMLGVMTLPTFHSMGFALQVIFPIRTGQSIGLFDPQYPESPTVPNPRNVIEATRTTGCDAILAVPTFVEKWAQSDDAINYLKTLKILFFGGGPLFTKSGDKLAAAGVRLADVFGATEVGPVANPFYSYDADPNDPDAKTPADWQWHKMPPNTCPRWDPQGGGVFELQFLTTDEHQPSVENLPDVKGYATSDLWEPHPTKKDLWRMVGRKDDVIVLGSGEKLVPIPQERHIAAHPLVSDVVMFGRAHHQPGIIIEPASDHAPDYSDERSIKEYIDKIWPVVEEANALAPTFGRLFKDMILVTDPTKPLPRAAKGNVMRQISLNLYQDAIENLYSAVETGENASPNDLPQSWSLEDIEEWLSSIAASINDDCSIIRSVDMFQQGFDSLHAIFMRNRIMGAIKGDTKLDASVNIPENIVFDHPSIVQLSRAIHTLVTRESEPEVIPDMCQLMRRLVAKYTADLPRYVILLTGSTGNIGSHILAALLKEKRVKRVYTLNRAGSQTENRERAAFVDRGLSVDLLRLGKLVSLVGDASLPLLDLDKDVFDELKHSVSHIVHNAWKVDFNHSLMSFESQISGTRSLADLALSTERPVKMIFTSSIGAVQGWNCTKRGPVPERALPEPELAMNTGYSASKWVAEQILLRVAESGLEAVSLRLGQICGSRDTGGWNVSDWVPLIIKTSLTVGCLPTIKEPISWVPVDDLAEIIRDIALQEEEKLPQMINVVHPHPVSWDVVAAAVNAVLNVNLPLVSFDEWTAKIEAIAHKGVGIENIPALKLLAFYRGFFSETSGSPGPSEFHTSNLQRYSATAEKLLPLRADDVRRWIGYWKAKKLL